MKVLFFGSDRFALSSLERLLESDHEVVGVVGKPDRAAGRGLTPAPTPVVEMARERSLRLLQPEHLIEAPLEGLLRDVTWDIGVVVAYGGLIPQWLLQKPANGFVNVHPSLLPRYRGAAPIERAIMNGASITGVTTVKMTDRLDSGDILMHIEEPVYEDDTAGTLRERLSRLAARLLVRTLDEIGAGRHESVPQEEGKATSAPSIRSGEGNIDWSQPAEKIGRLVRALDPDPGAYTYFRGKRVKVLTARVTDVPQEDEPGTLMLMGKEGFLVNTGTTCIQPLLLQTEGKSRMSAAEFSRGQRIQISERFSPER